MSREQNRIIFEELIKFIGLAIQVARVASCNTRAELTQLLRQTPAFQFTNSTIVEELENSECDISFEDFETVCSTLGFSVEKVLKCAVSMRDSEGKSEQEILREALSEAEYQIWKRQQHQ